jgi:repressor LexA
MLHANLPGHVESYGACLIPEAPTKGCETSLTVKRAQIRMDIAKVSKQLAGQVVSRVEQANSGSIAIHFASGSTLVVERRSDGVAAALHAPEATRPPSARSGPQPTRRQGEYLEFIKKYMLRFGVAPAESDIQRHFLVSAPSVNQMVRTLERRGLITRGRDFTGQVLPRSIRIVMEDL